MITMRWIKILPLIPQLYKHVFIHYACHKSLSISNVNHYLHSPDYYRCEDIYFQLRSFQMRLKSWYLRSSGYYRRWDNCLDQLRSENGFEIKGFRKDGLPSENEVFLPKLSFESQHLNMNGACEQTHFSKTHQQWHSYNKYISLIKSDYLQSSNDWQLLKL